VAPAGSKAKKKQHMSGAQRSSTTIGYAKDYGSLGIWNQAKFEQNVLNK
jgi:hypothetical protein